MKTKQSEDLERMISEYAAREKRLANSNHYSRSNSANAFMVEQRQCEEQSLFRDVNIGSLAKKRVLEVGCGGGGVLQHYLQYGAVQKNLFGIDIILERVQHARHKLGLQGISCADGQALPYLTGSFDLVLQYTAFSSVLDKTIKIKMARDMQRVLASDGVIIWYDFWLNPTNLQTNGIGRSELKSLFPDCHITLRQVTLAPPIARRLIRYSRRACEGLEKLKFLNSHYLAVVRC